MLLKRYNNIDYIMKMDWFDGIELINKAMEKEIEQKDWELWLSKYPDMTKENFISFSDFRKMGKQSEKQIKQQEESKKLTSKEILERAENAKNVHQGKHKGIVRG